MGNESNIPTMPPAMPGAPMPAPQQENRKAGKGLAVAALVVGIVALVLCWVPIVNNFALVLGLVALGLGIPALVISLKRRSKAKGMSIAALIISVVAIIGVIVSQMFYVSVLNDVADAVEEGADGVVPVSEEEQAQSAEAEVLELGASSTVGNEYDVTVDAINLDATDDILAMNEFNEAPEGQYVLVDLSVEYVGAEEGDPWLDLSVNLVGGDARQYDSTTCMAVLEQGQMDVPTLENGGTASYQLCMDVPAEAVKDAKLFVEPLMSFDDDARVYWAAK